MIRRDLKLAMRRDRNWRNFQEAEREDGESRGDLRRG